MSDTRLDRIEVKVDKVLEHQQATREILAAQHVSLKDHIRRTELLEKAVVPMVKKWAMVQGIGKFLAILGLIAAGIESVVALLEYLGKR